MNDFQTKVCWTLCPANALNRGGTWIYGFWSVNGLIVKISHKVELHKLFLCVQYRKKQEAYMLFPHAYDW